MCVKARVQLVCTSIFFVYPRNTLAILLCTKPFLFAWIEFIPIDVRRKHSISILRLIFSILVEIKQTLCKLLHLRFIFLRRMHIVLVCIFHIRNKVLMRTFLNHCIVRKWLSLAVRRLQPLVKGSLSHRSNLTKSLPALGVVGKISLCSSLLRRIAIHHLMLVKLTSLWVHLVNNINVTIKSIKVCSIIDEHINMVTINANFTKNIAISIVHGHAPRLTLLVLTAANHALWCFYGIIVATKRQMTLFVIASLLLSLCWFGLSFGNGTL